MTTSRRCCWRRCRSSSSIGKRHSQPRAPTSAASGRAPGHRYSGTRRTGISWGRRWQYGKAARRRACHSMGAATALVLAGTHPDVPGAILLEDPPAWWTRRSDTPAARERRVAMRERALSLKRKTREELIAGQRAEQPGWSDAELEPWGDAKQRFSLSVLSVYDQDNAASVDWWVLMRCITCPTLLITADPERGAIVTDTSGAALKALVPQLEIAYVRGAGHNIRRDQFTPYMDVVRRFLTHQQEQRRIAS